MFRIHGRPMGGQHGTHIHVYGGSEPSTKEIYEQQCRISTVNIVIEPFLEPEALFYIKLKFTVRVEKN